MLSGIFRPMIKAFGYMRTSSGFTHDGDNDTDKRQRTAILEYAQANDIEIVDWYYDINVRGLDPVHDRPAFSEMMKALLSNGVRTVLVETANWFARDLIIQETGYSYLKERGITLITVDDDHYFAYATPTADLIRQILGAVAQFEKASLVAKLRGARERKRAAGGRCEGRKPAPEAARTMAQHLRASGATLRQIVRPG